MAEVKKNILTKGLSGMLDDTIVFRVVGSRTIVASAPTPSEKEPTPGQAAHRLRFQQAILYAKGALLDEEQRAAYEEAASHRERQSSYNVAVADFMKAPDIQEIDISAYTGQVGDPIRVRVTDDFKVAKVSVAIYNSDGNAVEEGDAEVQDGLHWVYTATSMNMSLVGDKIVVKAYDLPGNVTEQEHLSE